MAGMNLESHSPGKATEILPSGIAVILIPISQQLPPHSMDWLSIDERAKIRLLPGHTAKSYARRRILIRWQLGLWLNIDPAEIPISYESSGAPILNNMNQHISWSHAGQVIALALSESHQIGIDAECHQRTGLSREQLRETILPECPKNFPVNNLLAIWTAREAILKAIHTGFQEYAPEEIQLPDHYFDPPLPDPLKSTTMAPDRTKLDLLTWSHSFRSLDTVSVSMAIVNHSEN